MTIKIESSRLTIVDHNDHHDIRIDYSSGGGLYLETDVCLDNVEFEVEAGDIDVGSEEELVDIIKMSGLNVDRIIDLLTPTSKVYTRMQVVRCFGSALRKLEGQEE